MVSVKFLSRLLNANCSDVITDGPLEKLWGGGEGGEFSSRNSLYEFFLGLSMNIF